MRELPASHPPLAVTLGDAAGIGPEIVARHFLECAPEDAVVVGDPGMLRRAVRLVAGDPDRVREVTRPVPLGAGWIPVLRPEGPPLPADLPYGVVDARAGAAAHAAIRRAIDLTLAAEASAIVTAPIHKEALRAAGIPFPGLTEILADATGTRDFAMMLVEGALRVVLVSIHVPLREAIERLTRASNLRAIRLAAEAGRALGIAAPRIAVAGLNPHAGEGGLFGREEIDILAPAIADARAEGIDASGPHPPDTVFMRARAGAFDLVVAQYHDQGLIPIKLNGIENGVNVTIGLPIVRTSVDHGTAFDIAGKGLASAASLDQAMRLARAMVAVRRKG